MTKPAGGSEAVALQGHRAGFVSRAAAAVIDLAAVAALGLMCLLFAALARYLVLGAPFSAPSLSRWLAAATSAGIGAAYLTLGWTIAGRTVGMQVLGLRLVGRAGRRLRPAGALLRAVLCLTIPAGLLWTLVSRRNASLQDLLLGSAVIYDWSYGLADEPGARTA